jgi:hypothetical protein
MGIAQFRLRTLMIAVAFVALILTVGVQGVLLHREAARARRAADAEQMLRAQAQMHLAEARAAMLHAEAAYERARAANDQKRARPDPSAPKP